MERRLSQLRCGPRTELLTMTTAVVTTQPSWRSSARVALRGGWTWGDTTAPAAPGPPGPTTPVTRAWWRSTESVWSAGCPVLSENSIRDSATLMKSCRSVQTAKIVARTTTTISVFSHRKHFSCIYSILVIYRKLHFYIESIFILNKISPGDIIFIIHDILQKVKGKQLEKQFGGVWGLVRLSKQFMKAASTLLGSFFALKCR